MRKGTLLLAALAAACSPPPGWAASDGDSIRHGDQRIRLIGIDAPEMPDSPRNCGRVHCPQGDPFASRAALQRLLDAGPVRCTDEGRDRYGRTLAECFVRIDGTDVSINAVMLWAGHAERYP